MLTNTQRVKAAIAACDDSYRAIGGDLRTVTERVEELWFEIDDHLETMAVAEIDQNPTIMTYNLAAIVKKLARIKEMMPD